MICSADKYSLIQTPDVPRIALLRSKVWENGSTLNVRLIGGNSLQVAGVHEAIEELMKHVNLDMRVNNASDSAIRITFNPSDGAWSMLGTDALNTRRGRATMNLGFMEGGTYLHELCHALGAIHEHQNPEGGIKWNRQAVIRDLAGPPNNWDMRTIESNMFQQYSRDQTNGSEVDRDSIMLYQIDPSWTLDGFSSKQNSVLSKLDKEWLSRQYPKSHVAEKSPVLSVIDAGPDLYAIDAPGETDTFSLPVRNAGRHIVDVTGIAAVVQIFHDGNLVGQSSNGQLLADLPEGDYKVRVSHGSRGGTGDYGIRVFSGPDFRLKADVESPNEAVVVPRPIGMEIRYDDGSTVEMG